MNNKKILVYGFKKSGYYVTKLLKENNLVTVLDKEYDEDSLEKLKILGVKYKLEDDDINVLDYDLIVRSPGIVPSNKIIKEAYDKGITVTNEVEIAYKYLPECKIICITGSNGKTTTTTMIYDILSKVFDNVHLAGNIGYPLSQIVPSVKKGDIIVMEISDHQLYDIIDFKCNIGVITNLCPTHLDFHGNYENYKNVKKKVFNKFTSNDISILNYKDKDLLELTKDIDSRKYYFNNEDNYIKDNYIYINNSKVLNIDDIKIKGIHNYENILACLLVVNLFNVDIDIIKRYLSEFKGVEHRIEYVTTYNNIEFYNDSKSTNPTSTITALKTFNKPIHLILGGFERSQDFNELNDYLDNVKCIYAIGEVTDRLADWANSRNINVVKSVTLTNALDSIKENVCENEVVLLSPASASWDQYDKFESRGEEYKNYIAKIFN